MPRSNPASRASFFASGEATTRDEEDGAGEEEAAAEGEVTGGAADGADTGAESEKSSREEAQQIRHCERSESREVPTNYNPFSHTYSATSVHATPGHNQDIYIICSPYIAEWASLTCGGSRSGSDRGRARGSEGEGRQRSDELLVLHRHHDGLPHLTHTNTHRHTITLP